MSNDLLSVQTKLLERGRSFPITTEAINMIFGLPVSFSGFEGTQVDMVTLDMVAGQDLTVLAPGYQYSGNKPKYYEPESARCIKIDGVPTMAFLKGSYYLGGKTGGFRQNKGEEMVTLVNLREGKGEVILKSKNAEPLFNHGSWWPGYSPTKYEEELAGGEKMILIERIDSRIKISFSRSN